MKVYQRPEFYVEQFMPNEYISACAWVSGGKFTADCGNSDVTIQLDTPQGNGVWTAVPVNPDGTTAGGFSMLYPVTGTDDYVFCGSIYDNHSGSAVSGEYYPAVQIQNGSVNDSYGHGKLCGCGVQGQSTAQVGAWHHHLTDVDYKNHS